jgi:hypothetical protein
MEQATQARPHHGEERDLLRQWHVALAKAARSLPPAEQDALLAWQQDDIRGYSVGSSDWPGWEKYIGPKPGVLEHSPGGDEWL